MFQLRLTVRVLDILCALVLSAASCTLALAQLSPSFPLPLPEQVAKPLRAANIPANALGAIVVRIDDGAIIMSHGAARSLQPASTLKLLTTLVGMEKLGPTFRGRSELLVAGPIADGVLQGDLILRGLADADLDWEALQRMLQTLRNQGIAEIRGDLVLDRHFFSPARPDKDVAPFDETPEFRYNVIPDALLLNTNLLQFDLESADQGMRIDMSPALERVSIVSDMKLVERACAQWEDGWKLPTLSKSADGAIQIELHGEFPKHCSTSTQINILDRVDFADRLFRSLWRNLGGTFRGSTREGPTPTDARLLAEHRSRTLAEVTRDINKRSDNPMARLLYLSLGALAAQEGTDKNVATPLRAEREVRAWLQRQGIAQEGMVLENGSGLSRRERIRPEQLAAILRVAARSAWAPEFLSSLPIVAIDGAMQNRLRDSPAAGRARIKTGSLRDVAAIAGYVSDARNRPCIVVAMINHPLAVGAVGQPVLDALIDWVAHIDTTWEMMSPLSQYSGS